MLSPPNELVEAARRGQPGAVSALIRTCQPNLARFARRTCSTTEDAEDAVQIALWQLHRRVGALRTVAAFAGWLFRIVERECYRLFRGRKDTVSLDELPEQETPPATAVPQDLQLDLARAIEQLDPPYREVLLLRDVHELTAPEVAAQLGLSVEAVKSRLHRGRTRVREQLMASGYWLKDGLPQAKRGSVRLPPSSSTPSSEEGISP
jgi:RNA polymerase sigma factor (sigma-70 family)